MNPVLSFKNLTKFELLLWIASLLAVLISGVFNPSAILSTIASSVGVTALIFVAKGDVLGQVLTVVFSLFYGVISFSFSYYGEMITYLCMTMPIAMLSVVSWLRHQYDKEKSEVLVNKLKKPEIVFMWVLTVVVSAAFYFILLYLNTANVLVSTFSVTTSFLASYLTFRRSKFYALSYAANDIVLIVLWVFATFDDIKYLPMIICFIMFFVNDMYGFVNWSKMHKRQNA